MADVITGNTQTAPTKAELISAIVQKELKFNAQLMPFVTDVSSFAVKGQDKISFPKLTSFNVEKRASGAPGNAQALVATKDTMDLDERAYVSWVIDANDAIQTTLEWDMECARRAASAHGRQVDLDLIVKIAAAAGLDAGLTAVTQDFFLDAREFIKKNDGDISQSVVAVSVAQEKAMLKIADFVRADAYGTSNIASGVIGRIYGMPVLVHNGLVDGQALVWDKSAVAIGFQRAPAVDSQKAIQYGTGAELHAMDQLYGIKALQLAEKGMAAGISPLIVKLN